MLKQLLSPLFIKLFFAILAAFFFALCLFLFLLNYQDEKTSVDDFITDTDMTASILQDAYSQDKALFTSLSKVIALKMGLSAKVLSLPDIDAEFIESEKILTKKGIAVYFDHKQDIFYAVYPLQNQTAKLVIADIPYDEGDEIPEALENQFKKEDEHHAFLLQALLALVFMYFLLTAVILLFAIRSISRHIHTLSDASQAFSHGELDVRLQTDIPAPLDVLATSFNKMAQTLQGTMHEQEVMSNAISHELRTPLTRLQLAVGLAGAKNNNPEVQTLIESMDRNIEELDKLTNAVLTIARLNHHNTKALSFEKMDIAALLRERIALASQLDNAIELTSSIEGPIYINGNELLIQMAMDNLLTNAVGYANHSVQVSASHKPNGHLEIMINDDGEGIPDEHKDSIFMPFSRIDESRDRKSGGFGLGLAIVKSIALKHDGSIHCVKGELSGAAFVLRLPLAKA